MTGLLHSWPNATSSCARSGSSPLFSPMKRAGLFSIPEAKRQLGKSQNPCFSSFPTATAEQEMPVFC